MPAKAGNPLTRKLGPAPVWAWAAAALVLLLVYRTFKSKGNVTSPQADQGSTTSPTSGANTNGGSTAAGGQGTAADNLSADLIAQLAGNITDTNSALVYGLQSTVGAVEGLGYGAFGLASQALDANLSLQQTILDKYTPASMGSTTSSPATGGGASTSKGGQYAAEPWVASPYYSAAGVAQGAGPAPSPATAQAYSLGTFRGAGYGSNLSIV